MELLFKKIQDTFNANKQVFTDKGLPPFRMIDMHMGQPDDPKRFEVVLPALFISYSIDEDDSGDEPDTIKLDFHLLFEPIGHTEGKSKNRDLGFQYLNLINTAKFMLKDLSAEDTGKLKRNGQRPAVTPYYKYEIISMKCELYQGDESFTNPAYVDGTIESISTDAGVREKEAVPVVGAIETY